MDYVYGKLAGLSYANLTKAVIDCTSPYDVLEYLGYARSGKNAKVLQARADYIGVSLPGKRVVSRNKTKKKGVQKMGYVQQIVMDLGKNELATLISQNSNWSELADAVGISRSSNSNAILRARILQVGLEMPYKIRRASKKKKSKQIELPHSEAAYQAPIPMAASPSIRGAMPPKATLTVRQAIKQVDTEIKGMETKINDLEAERGDLLREVVEQKKRQAALKTFGV